jgi:hypothetical protein
VEGVVSVITLGCCNETLVELLQQWGGGFEQTPNVGKTKILWMHWGISKDKEDLKCWILGPQIEFSNQPLLTWASFSPQHH